MKPFAVMVHSRKFRILAALAGILILFSGFCLFRACFQPLADGITLGGVEVGGLAPNKARLVLEEALEDTLYSRNLILELPEETLSLPPKSVGLKVSIGKAMFAARHAKAADSISLDPWLTMDMEAIRVKLESYAERYDTVLTQPSLTLEGTAPDLSTEHFLPESEGQVLVLTMGLPERHLDVETILADIRKAYAEAVILCREDRYLLHPEVKPEALPEVPDATAIAKDHTAEPVNDTANLKTYGLLHGSYGTGIDEAALAEQIQAARHGETIRIPIQYLPPEILGQEAFFQDVLGSCETKHNTNQTETTICSCSVKPWTV